MLKLGSLFDGSGGFPLAGVLHGVEPVWASEIEPYPVRVTTARFPAMKHLGDVTKIDGAAIEPVDIITFGSPCQDLSVAGKQAGLLKGERSNLFFEAIRIIKEMRELTDGIYPRIAIWENVPGAYSSNKGEDFRAVLQAFCSVKDETADVPRPAAGKWNPAGAIVGNGWSIAWRTFDAKFWGVPQRRKRIYLIADFGSERAGEILFEQEGLRGDSAESGTAGEGAAGDAEGGVGGGVDAISECRGAFETYHENIKTCATLKQSDHKGPQVVCFKERAGKPGGGKGILCGDKPFTLSTLTDQAICYPIDLIRESGGAFEVYEQGAIQAGSLKQRDYKGSQVVCYAIDSYASNSMKSKNPHSGYHEENISRCIDTSGSNPVAHQGGNVILEAYSVDCRNMNLTKDHGTLQAKENGGQSLNYMGAVLHPSKPPRRYIIRRLTPLECCRLQGFPDWWEDGVQGSDSARYKMWGNGIALPNAAHVVGCAVKLIKETQT